MEIKKKLWEVIQIWNVIDYMSKKKNSMKLHYALVKNKRALHSEIGPLQEVQNIFMGDMRKYSSEKSKIHETYADNGDEDNFKTSMDKLDTEFKETLEKEKEFSEMIQKEVTLEVFTIPFSELPSEADEKLTSDDLNIIFDLIDDQN